jgi:hypothetical protein
VAAHTTNRRVRARCVASRVFGWLALVEKEDEPTIADKGGAFLAKPFLAEALTGRVREVLGC